MCHAVLRITYHHDKAIDLIEVSTQEEMEKRRDEFRARPGVRKVTVLIPAFSYEEVRQWEITNHSTGEVVNEAVHKVSVPSLQEGPEEVSSPARSIEEEGIPVGPVEADGEGSTEAVRY